MRILILIKYTLEVNFKMGRKIKGSKDGIKLSVIESGGKWI